MEQIEAIPVQKKRDSSRVLLYVILGALALVFLMNICNLVATLALYGTLQPGSAGGATSASEPLPAELASAQGKRVLVEAFTEPFNNKDNKALYALFDPLAQVEYTREKMDSQMQTMYDLAGGEINEAVYSHYEYTGTKNGRKWFTLYYRVQTGKGPATLSISVAQQAQEPYTFWGFHINFD